MSKNYYKVNHNMKHTMSSIFSSSDYLSPVSLNEHINKQQTDYFKPVNNFHVQEYSTGSNLPTQLHDVVSIMNNNDNNDNNINNNNNNNQIWNNMSAWNATINNNIVFQKNNTFNFKPIQKQNIIKPRGRVRQSRISLGTIINSKNNGCMSCGR